jgi:Flp pilus assembly protein TadD
VKLKRYNSAIKSLKKSARANLTNVEAWVNLAAAYSSMGEEEMADSALKRARELGYEGEV